MYLIKRARDGIEIPQKLPEFIAQQIAQANAQLLRAKEKKGIENRERERKSSLRSSQENLRSIEMAQTKEQQMERDQARTQNFLNTREGNIYVGEIRGNRMNENTTKEEESQSTYISKNRRKISSITDISTNKTEISPNKTEPSTIKSEIKAASPSTSKPTSSQFVVEDLFLPDPSEYPASDKATHGKIKRLYETAHEIGDLLIELRKVLPTTDATNTKAQMLLKERMERMGLKAPEVPSEILQRWELIFGGFSLTSPEFVLNAVSTYPKDNSEKKSSRSDQITSSKVVNPTSWWASIDASKAAESSRRQKQEKKIEITTHSSKENTAELKPHFAEQPKGEVNFKTLPDTKAKSILKPDEFFTIPEAPPPPPPSTVNNTVSTVKPIFREHDNISNNISKLKISSTIPSGNANYASMDTSRLPLNHSDNPKAPSLSQRNQGKDMNRPLSDDRAFQSQKTPLSEKPLSSPLQSTFPGHTHVTPQHNEHPHSLIESVPQRLVKDLSAGFERSAITTKPSAAQNQPNERQNQAISKSNLTVKTSSGVEKGSWNKQQNSMNHGQASGYQSEHVPYSSKISSGYPPAVTTVQNFEQSIPSPRSPTGTEHNPFSEASSPRLSPIFSPVVDNETPPHSSLPAVEELMEDEIPSFMIARALFDYIPMQNDEINLRVGQFVAVDTSKGFGDEAWDPLGWWWSTCENRVGWCPSTFLEVWAKGKNTGNLSLT